MMVKNKLLYLICGCLMVILLTLVACTEPAPAEPEPTDEEIAAAKAELEERGGCSVFSLKAAEAVVGFPVGVPQYIPDGFYRQERINLSQLGGGLPAEMKHDDMPRMVDTFYFWEEDEKVMFFIEQSEGNPGMANSEPIQLCGGPGEKGYQPADPKRMYPSEILNLGAQIGDYHFFMYATLAGPLDEEEITKIFCSIEYD
jgi:hypothetical protein